MRSWERPVGLRASRGCGDPGVRLAPGRAAGTVLTRDRRSGKGRGRPVQLAGGALRTGVVFAVLAADRSCRWPLRSSSTPVGAARACGMVDPPGVLWLGRRPPRGGAGVLGPGRQPGQGRADALWLGRSLVRAAQGAAACTVLRPPVGLREPGRAGRTCRARAPPERPTRDAPFDRPQAHTGRASPGHGPSRRETTGVRAPQPVFHVEPAARAAGVPASRAWRSPLAKAPELV